MSAYKSKLAPQLPPEPLPPARRLPVQSRSFQTVMRIVDAASSLLRTTPLDDVTTTRIAAEADLSVGALYRFFPDKQSIIDAVAVRHVGDFRSLLRAHRHAHRRKPVRRISPPSIPPSSSTASSTPTSPICSQHPDFRAISFGRHISAATHEREASPHTGLPLLLKNFMLERLGIPNTPELDLKLRVVSEAGERLIAYAFEQPTDDERNRIVAEMKKMLAAYLFGTDARP